MAQINHEQQQQQLKPFTFKSKLNSLQTFSKQTNSFDPIHDLLFVC